MGVGGCLLFSKSGDFLVKSHLKNTFTVTSRLVFDQTAGYIKSTITPPFHTNLGSEKS